MLVLCIVVFVFAAWLCVVSCFVHMVVGLYFFPLSLSSILCSAHFCFPMFHFFYHVYCCFLVSIVLSIMCAYFFSSYCVVWLCMLLVVVIGLFLFIITIVDILFSFVCCVHVLSVVFSLLPWWCAHFLVFIFVLVWWVCCGISLGAFVFILVTWVGFRGFGFCGDFRGSVLLR